MCFYDDSVMGSVMGTYAPSNLELFMSQVSIRALSLTSPSGTPLVQIGHDN
jgi:hypothetical protein